MHWTLQNTLWIISFVVEVVVSAIAIHRRLWRTYPIFLTYLLCEVLWASVLLSIGTSPRHYATYFYVYWIGECVVCLTGFAAIAELFRVTFTEHLALRQWGIVLFRCSLAILLVIGLFVTDTTARGDTNKLVATILLLKRTESFVRLGVVGAFLAFVFTLGMPWAHPAVGIAAGFGIYGAVELVVIAARFRYGRIANSTYSWTIMLASLCQELLWAVYLLRRGPRSTISPGVQSHPETALEKLEEAVGSVLSRH